MKVLAVVLVLAIVSLGLVGAETALAFSQPYGFNVEVPPSRDFVVLRWTSSAQKVWIYIQKQLPDGRWESMSRYPRRVDNVGSFVYDTPSTKTGGFRFSIKPVGGVQTGWIPKENLH